ncbi:MAG: hypothetical protein HDR09_13025 [Lachnospiraceae bacterium]|nr:hypothetical protein [Lachnospiraceae bacterium]
MNYEKMWNKLKTDLVEKADDIKLSNESRNNYRNTIFHMTRIESEDANGEKSQKVQGNTAKCYEDCKVPLLETNAKELFEQITGHKVIDSLEKLESEIQKRKGRFDNQETIVVDECVYIPRDIWHEAAVRGIKIARFKLNIISSDVMPKVVFHGGFYGLKMI